MADIYRTGAYVDRNPELHRGDSPFKVDQILRMLARHGLKPKSVGDAGCGAGLILRLLQPHLPPETVLHGYDISPQAVELCREHENGNLSYFCGDLPSMDLEPYDLLLCIDVFEHVQDYIGFLRKLRPRGVFKLFHIPLEICAMSALFPRPMLENRKQVGHLHYFSRETALATLRDAGYEVVDWFYTPGYQLYRDAEGRREKILRALFRYASDDLAARALGGYSLLALAK